MLVDDAALKALEARLDEPESGRSDYWDQNIQTFEIDSSGRFEGASSLGNVSRKTNLFFSLAHWILQWPYRRMGRRFSTFRECQRLGRLLARRQKRQFTHDILRQVLSLALIREHLPLTKSDEVELVIGDGYGVMTSLLLLASPESRVVTINLTKPLLVDLVFCRMVIPDLKLALVSDGAEMNRALARPDIRLVAVQADNVDALTEAPIRLAVNIVSMHEMDMPVIHRYFHVLDNNKARKTVFYCCNKNGIFYCGNENGMLPLDVKDYPWSEKNKILVDEPCPWMLLQYGPRPPFYSRKKDMDRATWHRLA